MISPDKKILLRQLKKLERDLEEGNISRKKYSELKEQYTKELETIEAVENIRRLQGQKTPEKPLDHWVEESRKKKEEEEREELVRRYVKTEEVKERRGPNLSLIGAIIIVAAFFFGTGFGLYFMNLKEETPVTGTVTVNETAFPSFNNTVKNVTVTSTTNRTPTNTTPTTPTTPEKPSTPTTPTTPDNQGTGGGENPPSSP
ncbi:hypothetical protein ISG34_07905 [Methanothermobacter marburgensis]|uniref:Uncharacterized protein n=1 Tax=Methanothermobacter marburgensis (strain ATCC BAA-927 / DSM 2133 / JCM 14651 / NBRC 100331 / OCM 82 / Marburg) TaxID=79929 RepID=D9PY85_METTM|nr:hypothetical protein [Methanothermobacter marburgensis]ADL59183.1 conserved hypothetical protein [Methanothermobacter marburgensis str. Marburg]WBF09689.1 hypothetical protein ISG34_07905 [Methanothermobacter marburgensis]